VPNLRDCSSEVAGSEPVSPAIPFQKIIVAITLIHYKLQDIIGNGLMTEEKSKELLDNAIIIVLFLSAALFAITVTTPKNPHTPDDPNRPAEPYVDPVFG
jgi:hypothetical protein